MTLEELPPRTGHALRNIRSFIIGALDVPPDPTEEDLQAIRERAVAPGAVAAADATWGEAGPMTQIQPLFGDQPSATPPAAPAATEHVIRIEVAAAPPSATPAGAKNDDLELVARTVGELLKEFETARRHSQTLLQNLLQEEIGRLRAELGEVLALHARLRSRVHLLEQDRDPRAILGEDGAPEGEADG